MLFLDFLLNPLKNIILAVKFIEPVALVAAEGPHLYRLSSFGMNFSIYIVMKWSIRF
jgi:hypothetical protein